MGSRPTRKIRLISVFSHEGTSAQDDEWTSKVESGSREERVSDYGSCCGYHPRFPVFVHNEQRRDWTGIGRIYLNLMKGTLDR